MQRKLIQVGTSAAVLIPKEELEKQNVKIGDTVHIEMSKSPPAKATVDPEVIQWTDDFIKRHRRLLEKLADN